MLCKEGSRGMIFLYVGVGILAVIIALYIIDVYYTQPMVDMRVIAILREFTSTRGQVSCMDIQDMYKHVYDVMPPLVSVYASLDRLQRRGLAVHEWKESAPERGGRRKQVWSAITEYEK